MTGPLARIGPNHLLTSDPETTRRILASRSSYVRGPWYDALKLDPHRANLVTERNTRKHNKLRHQMSQGVWRFYDPRWFSVMIFSRKLTNFQYGGKEIVGVELAVDTRMHEWIDLIDQNWTSLPGESKKFEIARNIQFLTIDIISQLCFGEPLGFVKNQKDMHDFLKTLESRLPIVEQFSVLTELSTLLAKLSTFPWIKKILIPSATDTSGVGRIIGVCIESLLKRIFESN